MTVSLTGPAAKGSDIISLTVDIEYFSGELAKRLDRLAALEPRRPWGQAASLTRRVRELARDRLRNQRRHARRIQRLRT